MSPLIRLTTTISAIADLSDFFYRLVATVAASDLSRLYLATISVPKAEELVADAYRHGSKREAEKFFLDGMTQAMQNFAQQAHPSCPITIYYAFKQSETREAKAPTAPAGKPSSKP